MNINSLNTINFNNIKFNNLKKLQSTNNLERVPNFDMVSFSGKHKQVLPHIVTATTFGTQLYKNIKEKNVSFQDVENLLLKYSENVEVLPIEELENVEENAYVAFAISNLRPDFTFGDRRIYLDTPKENDDNTAKLLFAMNTAHEYTHIKQAEESSEGEFLKRITDGDYNYARALLGINEHVFRPFDTTMQHQILLDMLTVEDKQKVYTYKTVVPRQCNVNEQMIYKAFGVKNKKEFENKMNSEFDKIFSSVINNIVASRSEVINLLPVEKIETNLYSNLRKMCALQARNEAEAYTTENRVAKKIMNINKNLTTDIIPMYYEMLAECLEKENKK